DAVFFHLDRPQLWGEPPRYQRSIVARPAAVHGQASDAAPPHALDRADLQQLSYRDAWFEGGEDPVERLVGELHPIPKVLGGSAQGERLVDLRDVAAPTPVNLHRELIAGAKYAEGWLLDPVVYVPLGPADPAEHGLERASCLAVGGKHLRPYGPLSDPGPRVLDDGAEHLVGDGGPPAQEVDLRFALLVACLAEEVGRRDDLGVRQLPLDDLHGLPVLLALGNAAVGEHTARESRDPDRPAFEPELLEPARRARPTSTPGCGADVGEPVRGGPD